MYGVHDQQPAPHGRLPGGSCGAEAALLLFIIMKRYCLSVCQDHLFRNQVDYINLKSDTIACFFEKNNLCCKNIMIIKEVYLYNITTSN